MSIDYYVYIKNIDAFSISKCEEYFSNLGPSIEIYPEYDAYSHMGYLPIKIEGDFISGTFAGKSFLSGFEI